MFKHWKFSKKIFCIPALATLSYLFLFFMTQSFNQKNADLLDLTVQGYSPALEFSRDLLVILDSIQRNLQDAVTSADEDALVSTDNLRDAFLKRITHESENPVLEQSDLNNLEILFLDYYIIARQTSEQMLDEASSSVMYSALQEMTEKYNTFKAYLETNIQQNRENMVAQFVTTRTNNRITTIISSITIGVCIFLLSAFSAIVIRAITRPLNTAISLAENVAAGNLNIEFEDSEARDEAGILIRTFHKMVVNLRDLMGEIKEGASSLAAAAGQISTSVTQIASAATETASAANETSITVEEVRQTATDSNQKAKNVSESSQKAVDVSRAGESAVSSTIEGMQRIEAQMEFIAESILKLSEHGQAIGEIIATVEDVAEQSSLLAVNASIEAVKAGEQGRGFSVVAQEVRNLAEQSKQATARVRSILDDIQNATSVAVMKTEQGSRSVEDGVKLSTDSGQAIQRLASSVSEASLATRQISVSSQEQLVGMDQVVAAMESIKQASDQNVTATKQVESASQELYHLGEKLNTLMDKYIV